MNIEEELKTLIIKEYGTLKNFASILQIPYSTIDTIFKRGLMKAGIANIIAICNELDISVDSLATNKIEPAGQMDKIPLKFLKPIDNSDKPLAIDQTHLSNLNKLNDIGKEKVYAYAQDLVDSKNYEFATIIDSNNIIKLPIYEDLKASAGLGSYVDESIRPVLKSFKDTTVPHQADHGIYLKGNSMEPLLSDGELVFVSKQPSIDFGEIGIFIYNEEVYCKRLIKEGKKIILRSENEDYNDIIIEDPYPLVTVGKVLLW